MISLLVGMGLMAISVALLLSNITVSHFGFYRIGGISTGIILLLLFAIFLFVAVVKMNWRWLWAVGIDVVAMIASVIGGSRLVFRQTSLLNLLLLIIMFVVGFALFMRAALGMGKKGGD